MGVTRAGWRSSRPWLLVGLGMAIGLALAAPLAGQPPRRIIQAEKILAKVKLVDGIGSGLDADTLRGMDPAQLRASQGLDAETLGGMDARAFATRLRHVVVVSHEGGQFASVQEAIDSITDASASDPCLVLVGPGSYTERVTLKPGITVRGYGIGVTTLVAGPAASCTDGYTVKGATGATVTDLTIMNRGAGSCGVGILNAGVSPATYRHLLIATSMATDTIAVMNDASDIELTDVAMQIGQGPGSGDAIGVDQANGSSLVVSGSSFVGCSNGHDIYGVANDASSATIRDSAIHVVGCSGATGSAIAIRNLNGSGDSVTVDRSTVSGATNAIVTTAGYTTRVGSSNVAGGAVSGTVTCAQVYDENYASFVGPACP